MKNNALLKEEKRTNFFGFESVDENGKKHSNPAVLRGNGTLKLTN